MAPDALPPVLPPAAGSPAPPSPSPVSPASRVRVALGLLVLAAYVAVPGLLGAKREPGAEALLPGTTGRLVVACAIELALFAAAFGVALWLGRIPRHHLFLRWPRTPWIWPRALGWSVALRLAVGFLLGGTLVAWQWMSGAPLDRLDGLRPKVEALVELRALDDPLYLFLSLTLVSFVLAGLREELWRAGMIGFLAETFPRAFGGRLGPWLAILPVALLFGLAHTPQGWFGVAATAILGVGLGAILLFHRSVWDAVLAHGFFNATTFALLPLIGDLLSRSQAR